MWVVVQRNTQTGAAFHASAALASMSDALGLAGGMQANCHLPDYEYVVVEAPYMGEDSAGGVVGLH